MVNIELFDTTLRDGTQGEELNLSLTQKREIAKLVHEFAPNMILEISYAQGDFNPKVIFNSITAAKSTLKYVASTFGSTHKPNEKVEDCPNVKAMLESGAKIATIFGKTWKDQIYGLNTTPKEYLQNIEDTVNHLRSNRIDRVIYDAEHFFWGYREDPQFAKETLKSAIKGGADTVVFCDTKGGIIPTDVIDVVNDLSDFIWKYRNLRYGFHGHDDTGCAVANTMTFVDSMKSKVNNLQIQGTINGYGERCGNANLITIIPNLIEKVGVELNIKEDKLTKLANQVSNITGIELDPNAPYVSKRAFAHKGGIHIHNKNNGMSYTHCDPKKWGNKEIELLTSMSGKEMYKRFVAKYGYNIDKNNPKINDLYLKIKNLEDKGYKIHCEPAEQLLLVHSIFGDEKYDLELDKWKTSSEYRKLNGCSFRESETILKTKGEYVSMNNKGPVDSQYKAVYKMLSDDFPYVKEVELIDFKVGITKYSKESGSESRVISHISFKNNGNTWTTQGVSTNILESTLEAIMKGFKYYILINEVDEYKPIL